MSIKTWVPFLNHLILGMQGADKREVHTSPNTGWLLQTSWKHSIQLPHSFSFIGSSHQISNTYIFINSEQFYRILSCLWREWTKTKHIPNHQTLHDLPVRNFLNRLLCSHSALAKLLTAQSLCCFALISPQIFAWLPMSHPHILQLVCHLLLEWSSQDVDLDTPADMPPMSLLFPGWTLHYKNHSHPISQPSLYSANTLYITLVCCLFLPSSRVNESIRPGVYGCYGG